VLTVVGANGAPAGQWVDHERFEIMRVRLPSGGWAYLRVTPTGVFREGSYVFYYAEPNCLGIEYDNGTNFQW